jgi:NAD dependent epimerase/dehydratase family enzyme
MDAMNILITGGLGFVGRHLSNAFLLEGHRVTATGRSQNPVMIDHPDFHYVAADTSQAGEWQDLLADRQVVVNLAGKSIFTIWTERTKRQIYDSRILTTRNLIKLVLGEFGKVLLASQRVRPAALAGFEFGYPDIDAALEQIVR